MLTLHPTLAHRFSTHPHAATHVSRSGILFSPATEGESSRAALEGCPGRLTHTEGDGLPKLNCWKLQPEGKEGARAVERFWDRVDRSGGPAACWPWTGYLNAGYGSVRWNGRSARAHRLACFLGHGPSPEDKPFACHSRECVTPACCNPAHLRWDTPKANSEDCDAVGHRPRGETAKRTKLTEEIVRQIIARAAGVRHGDRRALGARYGITGQQVGRIIDGTTWKHIPRDAAVPASRTAVSP